MPPKLPADALPHVTDAHLLDLARSLVLKSPNLDILRPEQIGEYPVLVQLIEQQLKKYDAARKLMLPDLSFVGNQTVGIFSDYSGEGSGSYHAYSFLVCAWNAVGLFQEQAKELRKTYSLGDKEIEFKDLRMGSMRNALPSYLSLLDKYVPGFLFTLVVDKRLRSLFGPSARSTLKNLAKIVEDEGLGRRAGDDAEKLLRIVHTSAYLAALLGREGQKLFWMTDHDAICANQVLHEQALALLQRAVGIYSKYQFALIGGARPFEEKSTDFLDLLSAADLTAGAIGQYMSNRDSMGAEEATVKDGGEQVLLWLGHDGLALKKFSLVMRPGDNGIIHSGTIEFTPLEFPPDAAFVPVQV
jgi:hypothetical protein